MLNYYTKFLGLTGEIKKEDLLITEDKTKLEKEMKKVKDEVGMYLPILKAIKSNPKIMKALDIKFKAK